MTSSAVDAVVVDTMVVSWLVERDPLQLRERYRDLIGPARVTLALQTIAELRSGTLIAGWGDFRRRRLERSLAAFSVFLPGDATASAYARLRADCHRIGHGLAAKDHDGDRWIAAAAVQLDVPLVSHDGIFQDVPGLRLITALGD